jgi:hypothetical protein
MDCRVGAKTCATVATAPRQGLDILMTGYADVRGEPSARRNHDLFSTPKARRIPPTLSQYECTTHLADLSNNPGTAASLINVDRDEGHECAFDDVPEHSRQYARGR